jgi:hypothetical protein
MTQNGKGVGMVMNYYSIKVVISQMIFAPLLIEDQNESFTMSWLQHDWYFLLFFKFITMQNGIFIIIFLGIDHFLFWTMLLLWFMQPLTIKLYYYVTMGKLMWMCSLRLKVPKV